jgi:glycosyltransferase involved in cell wall biosynthesis
LKTIASVVWFDVSSTMRWTGGTAGGILRTEVELCSSLMEILGERLRLCDTGRGRLVPVRRPDFVLKALAMRNGGLAHVGVQSKGHAERLQALYGLALRRGPSFLRPVLRAMVTASRNLFNGILAVGTQVLGTRRPDRVEVRDIAPGDIYINCGLIWSPALTVSRYLEWKRSGIKLILCCYDLIPFLFPHLCADAAGEYSTASPRDAARVANTILCISESTKRDLSASIGASGRSQPRLTTFRLGSNHACVIGDSASPSGAISRDFVLFVSTIERRKNHSTVYKAYVTIRERYHLTPPLCVIVGAKGWGVNDVLTFIDGDPRVKGDFLLLEHVGDGGLRWLYEHCLFTIFPSVYEGWGLPVAESLSYGKFVLASSTSSIPEAGGSFAEYLDPWDVQQWAERIAFYSSHSEERQELEGRIRQHYVPSTWSGAAETVRQEIERLQEDGVSE